MAAEDVGFAPQSAEKRGDVQGMLRGGRALQAPVELMELAGGKDEDDGTRIG